KNSTTANTITQTAPAAPGNFYDFNNYNSTQGVTVGRGLVTYNTAAPSCGTATITTNSSRSKTMGKKTFVQVDFTITSVGTCVAGTCNWTTPLVANTSAGFVGRDISGVTTQTIACAVTATGSNAACTISAAPVVNTRFAISGTYENQ